MELDKQMKIIIILVIIIGLMIAVLGYMVFFNHNTDKIDVKNTTTNNTTVVNETVNETSSESGQYGYCAICGKALTYSEASDEYTQGKVCDSCARNPYYQHGAGAEYANRKLYEAYPEDYSWMYEDSNDISYDYDDSNDYDDSYYEDYDYDSEEP